MIKKQVIDYILSNSGKLPDEETVKDSILNKMKNIFKNWRFKEFLLLLLEIGFL